MKLNEEQAYCVELARERNSFKIQAGAGTGKTTVLEHIARELGGFSYYLVFNNEARQSARQRFAGMSVTCHSNHSLAHSTHGYAFRNANKIGQHFNYNVIAQQQKIRDFRLAAGNFLPASSMAHLACKVIKAYCQSGDQELSENHVPAIEINDFWIKTLGQRDQFLIPDLTDECIRNARAIWSRMLDLRDPMPITHDVYLKLWALSDPIIPADYILYDENQDANPTIIQVLNRQKCPLFLVGDENQQLYSWRGAINAMRSFLPEARIASLTQSYRFGESIAEVANLVLRDMCKSSLVLRGNPQIRSRLDVLGRPQAFINRTNAGCLSTITDLMEAGTKRIFYDQAKPMADLVAGIQNLKRYGTTTHLDLKGFRNYDDLLDYLKNNETNELHGVVNIAKKFGEAQVISILQEIGKNTQESAQVIVTTGHRAKGREWESVQLGSDFIPRNKKPLEGEDANVLYVAATRARKELDISNVVPIFKQALTPAAADPVASKSPQVIRRRK